MQRITHRGANPHNITLTGHPATQIDRATNKLAAYEDTGMDPEDVVLLTKDSETKDELNRIFCRALSKVVEKLCPNGPDTERQKTIIWAIDLAKSEIEGEK